ncbi:hypothetical protein PtB15_10B185 [Puccinia triticina]|nr:hypothetical protein PtB15_10B185 [Puccinia triticina]
MVEKMIFEAQSQNLQSPPNQSRILPPEAFDPSLVVPLFVCLERIATVADTSTGPSQPARV